ncbi:MAG TPA: hypothetical protein PKG98_08155 [Myxococcota bacterium]|jgi:hypothetical protein|nr:hypothetical protein [Myxococcota bacterium]
MAIYRMTSGKYYRDGTCYQVGDTFEYLGELPWHMKNQCVMVAADPPEPEPVSTLKVETAGAGWYRVLKANGGPLTKSVRRAVAVSLAGEAAVLAAEKEG